MAIRYSDPSIVREKIKNKVRIQSDPSDPRQVDRMSETLFLRLIEEAEAAVENDLSPRYKAPFQTIANEAFLKLPDPTRYYLRTMCELMAVVRILETDFGTGGAANGDPYKKTQEDRYTEMLDKQIEKRSNSFNMFKQPPLPGLCTNDHNSAADDGFAGRILSTSDGHGGYPKHQINDPSENIFNVTEDDLCD